MTPDNDLKALCKALLDDPEVVCIANWRRLVMVGVVQAGSARLFGYCFDENDDWEAAAPRQGGTLDLLRRLNSSVVNADPQGRRWVSCLLVIDADGQANVAFEYEDPARWTIDPRNLTERLEQFVRVFA